MEFQSSLAFKQEKVKAGAVEGAIEGALAGTSRPVRSRLIEVVKIVLKEPGIKNIELQERLKIFERTVTSDIKRLEKYISYKGSKKGGGYEASNILLNLVETKTAD